MEVSSRGRNALLTALGVLVALIVVAIAARGSIPTGEGGTRGPTQALIDILFTLYLLTIASSAVLAIYLLVLRRQIEAQGGMVRRRTPLESLLIADRLHRAASLLARRLAGQNPLAPPEAPPADLRRATPGLRRQQPGRGRVRARVRLGGGRRHGRADRARARRLVVRRTGAQAGARRARSREDRLATELAAAVDESLDDLRAEPDPRRAVIAAYARLERVLAAHRLPRRPAEAPLEYLARMLDDLSVSPEAARRLTDLFERAKFSQHAVGTEMKEEAISALETVRDDLLAARALAEQERKAAIAAQRERTA